MALRAQKTGVLTANKGEFPKLIRGMTIDIGRVNFAVYVEEVSTVKLQSIKNDFKKMPGAQRKTFNYNSSLGKIRKAISLTGKRIYMDVQDFTDHTHQPYDDNVRSNLIDYLDSISDLLQSIDIILIEKQYYNPRSKCKSNIDAIIMAEFVYAYLTMKIHTGFFYSKPALMYYPSKYKTEMWNAPPKMTKPKRKTWSGKTALAILEERQDEEGIRDLKTKNIKKDDMGDCLLMWLTFLCHFYLLKGL